MTELWWERIGARIRHRSPMLAAVLSDGQYLAAWPQAAKFAPVAALLVGVAIGKVTSHNDLIFTASLTTMALLLAIGQLSAAMGAWAAAGYAVANFVFVPHLYLYGSEPGTLASVVRPRVPLLIAYLVLFGLVALVPVLARVLRQLASPKLRGPTAWGDGWAQVSVVTQALIAALLTYAWTVATPTLIRPVYSWIRLSPPLAAIEPLQLHGMRLAVVAAVAVIARGLLAAFARAQLKRAPVAPLVKPVAAAAKPATAAPAPTAAPHPLRELLVIPLRAALMTFLLAGLLNSWKDAWILMSILVIVEVLRSSLARATAWTQLISRVPILLRFAIGVAVSFYLARAVMKPMFSGVDFTPMIYALGVALAAFALLLPAGSVARRPAPAVKT